MTDTRHSSLPLSPRTRFSWRNVMRAGSVLAVLAVAACAQSPEKKAEQAALEAAKTDPDFCYSAKYDGLLVQAWQRAHATNAATQQDTGKADPATLPPVSVNGATVMPELSVPPYSRRSCRMSIKVGNAAPESGFLAFTYLTRNGQTQSALAEWFPDSVVTEKYDATMEQIKAGVDMSNPDLKTCLARYPGFETESSDPMVKKAAFDLRAHLIRRCIANKVALRNLYSDLYFIHR